MVWMAQFYFRAASGLVLVGLFFLVGGCRSAGEHRRKADETAYRIIEEKQVEALGRKERLSVDPAAQTLRRRIFESQQLAGGEGGALGTDTLEAIEHWPEDDDYLAADRLAEPAIVSLSEAGDEPLELDLRECLQVAARNSRQYQDEKETVFLSALELDLERDAFRNTFAGLTTGSISSDQRIGRNATDSQISTGPSLSRTLKSGAALTGQLALDLASLLSGGGASAVGSLVDTSIELPLMRGAGSWVVTEPLTQAERETIYAIWQFERFKRQFAVEVTDGYLGVLQQLDEVANAEANYRRLVAASRSARAKAAVGDLPPFQVDQAIQDELRARSRWISARERYQRTLDNFKLTLGLPTDARIALDSAELERLAEIIQPALDDVQEVAETEGDIPAADASVELVEPESVAMPEPEAIREALANRLDLRTTQGRVYDAQRKVTVASNGFLPELTLLGTTSTGERRGLGSAGRGDVPFRLDRGQYDAVLSFDPPFERTRERNTYRQSLINLEKAVRQLQEQEDRVKLEIRNDLRDLLESRENLRIQTQAVALAQRRVDAANLLLELGDADIRDLLEAQEALVSAQNALTSALVRYRVAQLSLERDLGRLEVGPNGLWEESGQEQQQTPEEAKTNQEQQRDPAS